MALQSIRYGGGVWRQHEELRLRLEAEVDAYERELALQRQQLTDSQEAHETSSLCERQQELLSENTNRIARLELRVDTSREEELRLCELLYAEQEKNEAHAAELAKQQREVAILTRASRVKSAQNDALARERANLAQTLAKLRGANPKVHFAVSRSSSSVKKNRELVESKQQPQSVQAPDEMAVSKGDQRYCGLDGADQNASAASIASSSCCCDSSYESNNGQVASGGFLWKELQLMSAKLRNEQRQSAQLRDQIDALETSERELMARFREEQQREGVLA